MAKAWLFNIAVLFASLHFASCTKAKLRLKQASPIRRVVVMLNMMAQKIHEESLAQQKLYDDFQCDCKDDLDGLNLVIDAGGKRIPVLERNIQGKDAEKSQLTSELAKATTEHTEAVNALNDASAVRTKEAGDFADSKADLDATISAIDQAEPVLTATLNGGDATAGDATGGATTTTDAATTTTDAAATTTDATVTDAGGGTGGGTGTGFIQKHPAAVFIQKHPGAVYRIKQAARAADLSQYDHDAIMSFLSQGDSVPAEASAPFMEILGILKQLHENTEKQRTEEVNAENAAIATFTTMAEAKTEQIHALAADIQEKTARLGNLDLKLEQESSEYENLKGSVEAATAARKHRKKACASAAETEGKRQQASQEELKAISETIQMLNGEQAANLFKNTFPEARVFLSLPNSEEQVRKEALRAINGGRNGDHRMDFLAMSLRNKHTTFDKVMRMISSMIQLLKKEEYTERRKKDGCQMEIDHTTEEIHDITLFVADLDTQLNEDKSSISTLTAELKQLTSDIELLDKQVAAATELRKNENAEYQIVINDKRGAREALENAQKRLGKMYGLFFQKQDRMRDRPERDIDTIFKDQQNNAAPSFTQLGSKSGFQLRRQDAVGVIDLLHTLSIDIEKEAQAASAEEEQAQIEYDTFIKDATYQRKLDTREISNKEEDKAETEMQYHKNYQLRKSKVRFKRTKSRYLMDKHRECDELLANFDHLQLEREHELDALYKVQFILQGASGDAAFGFLQTSAKHQGLRRHDSDGK